MMMMFWRKQPLLFAWLHVRRLAFPKFIYDDDDDDDGYDGDDEDEVKMKSKIMLMVNANSVPFAWLVG